MHYYFLDCMIHSLEHASKMTKASPKKPSLRSRRFRRLIMSLLFPIFHSSLQWLQSFPVTSMKGKYNLCFKLRIRPKLNTFYHIKGYKIVNSSVTEAYISSTSLMQHINSMIICVISIATLWDKVSLQYLVSVIRPCKLHLWRNPSIPSAPLARIKCLII